MKSFKTILNEGRLEERLFHALIKAHLKQVVYKNKLKKSICYYDPDVTNSDQVHFSVDILKTIRVNYLTNAKGDIAYDYEAI
jgi:hypothetical protein